MDYVMFMGRKKYIRVYAPIRIGTTFHCISVISAKLPNQVIAVKRGDERSREEREGDEQRGEELNRKERKAK